MLATFVEFGLVSLALLFVHSRFQGYQRNVATAKQSGLPYVIVPVFFQSIPWILFQGSILPILHRLPTAWTEPWLSLIVIRRLWHRGYKPFAHVGADTFIAVSATQNVLWTCDPEAVVQIGNRRDDFPKPLELMQMLNIYDPTITATEGKQSRLYRKTVAPSLNDRTHAAAWDHMLHQSSTFLERLTEPEHNGSIQRVETYAACLTLHVFSYAAYGKKMDWANNRDHQGKVPPSHSLSYSEAISTSLDRMMTICMTPIGLLKKSPLCIHKDAYKSFTEFRRYMEEMRDEKQGEIMTSGLSPQPNILGSLVQASRFPGNPLNTTSDDESTIDPAALLGNIYIFLLAGHETSANTLTLALTLMACFPSKQKRLQDELDPILGSRHHSQWTYGQDFPKLLNGYTGAIFNEVLRNFTVLPIIPKRTQARPQILSLGSRQFTVPAYTMVMINTSAVHRHPRHWPTTERSAENTGEDEPFPASTFKPEIWFQNTDEEPSSDSESSEIRRHPAPGTYIPFGEGARACMGQRFAKASFCAAFARIFKEHSVELDVGRRDAGLTRRQAWCQAQSAAKHELSKGSDFLMSLKMTKGVSLRFVRRGQAQWMDM